MRVQVGPVTAIILALLATVVVVGALYYIAIIAGIVATVIAIRELCRWIGQNK